MTLGVYARNRRGFFTLYSGIGAQRSADDWMWSGSVFAHGKLGIQLHLEIVNLNLIDTKSVGSPNVKIVNDNTSISWKI